MYLDVNGQSSGELIWDDGDSLDDNNDNGYAVSQTHVKFKCRKWKIESEVLHDGYRSFNKNEMMLNYVAVFGVQSNCSKVEVNGKAHKFYFDAKSQVSVAATQFAELLHWSTRPTYSHGW